MEQDDFTLEQEGSHGLTPGSFILDVTPMGVQQARQGAVEGIAQPVVHTAKGDAGFVLTLPNGSAPVRITRCAQLLAHLPTHLRAQGTKDYCQTCSCCVGRFIRDNLSLCTWLAGSLGTSL